MPVTLHGDENFLRTQRDLAALGPAAVEVLKRYLAGELAAEVPGPMVRATYDMLDRLGLVRQATCTFAPPVSADLSGGESAIEAHSSGT